MNQEVPINISKETLINPLRRETTHRLLFQLTSQKLLDAEARIKNLWLSFVVFGIAKAFERAQASGSEVEFEAPDTTGKKAWYAAKYLFSGRDNYAQPLDAFGILKENPDRYEPPAKITVATLRGEKSRYSKLVSLETEEEQEEAMGNFFYFVADKLAIVQQTAIPGSFFHADTPQNQSIRITKGLNNRPGHLMVEIGPSGEEQSPFRYSFFQDYVTAQNLSVDGINGEIGLFTVSPQGIIRQNPPFSLPHAVTNISNFELATAS